MPTATLEKIMDVVVDRIDDLGLQFEGEAIPIAKRKLPRKAQTIDPSTLITVSIPDSPDQLVYAAFGVQWWKYSIEITVIGKNDMNLVKNLDIYTQFRELIRAKFLPPFSQPIWDEIPEVFDLRVRPMVLFNRAWLAQNYDYQQLGLEATATI